MNEQRYTIKVAVMSLDDGGTPLYEEEFDFADFSTSDVHLACHIEDELFDLAHSIFRNHWEDETRDVTLRKPELAKYHSKET